MTFHVPGRLGSAGWARTATVTPHPGEKVSWVRIDIPQIVLAPSSCLLVIQGIRTSDLLPPDMALLNVNKDAILGPFLLLRAGISSPFETPLRLVGVTLGVVVETTLDSDGTLSELLRVVVG